MSKICAKCGGTDFYSNKACKPCTKEYTKNWYHKNKAQAMETRKKWVIANRIKSNEIKNKWSKLNPVKDKISKSNWALNNKERSKIIHNKWKAANPEKIYVMATRYRKKNQDYYNAKTAAYKLKKLHATPKWVDEDELWAISEAYRLAKLRTKLFGFPWDVDHIIPLNGKNVCGLHTLFNLQVIPETENCKKSNKHFI